MKRRVPQLQQHQKRAQSIIEFSFAMILVALLIYGLVRVFQWSGLLLADHRYEHERSLVQDPDPLKQLSEDYYTPRKIDGVFRWHDHNKK